MRQVPLFEVKNKLSFFVQLAEQGERIEITRHGKTSAVLVGAESQTTTEDISKSPFYLAYINFRKKMNFDSFSEESSAFTSSLNSRMLLPIAFPMPAILLVPNSAIAMIKIRTSSVLPIRMAAKTLLFCCFR